MRKPTGVVNTINDTGNFNIVQVGGTFLTISGILKEGNVAGGATISAGTLLAGYNEDLVIRTDGVNDSLTISSVIGVNGVNDLVKSGAGTLTLSANNTFTGDVYLNGGTLIVTTLANTATGNLGALSADANGFKNLFISNNAVFRSTISFNDAVPGTGNVGIVFNIGSGGGTIDIPTGITITPRRWRRRRDWHRECRAPGLRRSYKDGR